LVSDILAGDGNIEKLFYGVLLYNSESTENSALSNGKNKNARKVCIAFTLFGGEA
jgi:hypothetical protein